MSVTMLVTMAQLKTCRGGPWPPLHRRDSGRARYRRRRSAASRSPTIDMQEMTERTIHFVDWFAHELKGWPKDTNKDFNYPARELVHLGLVQHFPCESI